jgi:hypothetical protein
MYVPKAATPAWFVGKRAGDLRITTRTVTSDMGGSKSRFFTDRTRRGKTKDWSKVVEGFLIVG